MNDQGIYMYPTFQGKWLPDTPAQRNDVIDRLRDWTPFSNSSPVEGIIEAIRTYHTKRLKISLYVFGDEFTGSSIDAGGAHRRFDQSRGPRPASAGCASTRSDSRCDPTRRSTRASAFRR